MPGYKSTDNPNQAVSSIKVKKKKRKHHSTDDVYTGNEVSEKDTDNQEEECSQLTYSQCDMEDTSLNNHMDKENRQRKKKHRRKNERTLVENVSEHQISYSKSTIDKTDVLDDILHSEHTAVEECTIKKKKKKKHRHEDDRPLVETMPEHSNLEKSAVKKKKHCFEDDRNLMESFSEHQISYNDNIATDKTDVFDGILHSEQTNLVESTKKKKKKKQHHADDRCLVETMPEQQVLYNNNLATGKTDVSDGILHSEPTRLEGSERKKKKKKHHHEDDRSLVENVSEHQISCNDNLAIGKTDVSDGILHSEPTQLEGSERKKKKKKHCHEDDRSLVQNEISYTNIVAFDRTDVFGGILPSEGTDLEESARKKKKKKRHHEDDRTLVENVSEHHISNNNMAVDKTYVLGDILPLEHTNIEEPAKKKKKKHSQEYDRSLVENVPEHQISYNENIALEKTDVLGDILPSEHTNLEEPARKKKKKNKHCQEDDKTLVENVPEHQISDVSHLEESARKKKKKKKNCHEDGRTLVENASEHEISQQENMAFNKTDAFGGILHSEHTDLEESVRRKKKKKKKKHGHEDDRTLVENLSEHEISQKENMAVDGTDAFGAILHSEHSNLEESARKKKKKNGHGNVSEHQILYNDNIADDTTDVFNDVLHSENTNLDESVRKKKKKHRSFDIETSNNNIFASDGHAKEDTGELVEQKEFESQKTQKKNKKKRKTDLSVEETSAVLEQILDVQNCHPDDKGASEETMHEQDSARKKKKKLKNLDVEVSNNILSASDSHTKENTGEVAEPQELWSKNQKTQEKNKKKRKTDPPMEETPEVSYCRPDEQGASEETIHENLDEHNSVRKKKKKKHRQEEDTLVECGQPPNSVTTNTEVSKKHKKKNILEEGTLSEMEGSKSQNKKKIDDSTKENECQTESSMNTRIKQEMVSSDDEDEECADNIDNVSMVELSESITERTDSEANNDTETPARTNMSTQSERRADQQEASSETANVISSKKIQRPSVKTRLLIMSLRQRDVELLEEYFPNIRSKSESFVRGVIASELERIRKAKLQGILYNVGRFTSEEDELIKKNVECFLELVGLESAEMLFHSYRFPEQKPIIDKLKKQYHFSQRIAEGVYRTVSEVKCRGGKLYDLSGKKGRFSQEEVNQLLKQQAIHGNNWGKVGSIVGRSSVNCQLKASQLRVVAKKGNWSIEEVNRLIQAVKTILVSSLGYEPEYITKEMVFGGISWAEVEDIVKTRNWTHCKSKWYDLMYIRMNNGVTPFEGALSPYTYIKIITWLHDANLKKDEAVDWEQLCSVIGNVPAQIMQARVYKMKCRYVPNWRNLTFKENVDYLYENVLPLMERKLELAIRLQKEVPEAPEKKDEFPISDLFREYTGEERKKRNYKSAPFVF